MDLAPLGIHHDGDGKALLHVEAAHESNHVAVPLARAVAHVDPGHVHPAYGERLQLLELARRRPDRADELRPPRAAEPILLELSLRDGVDLDGAGLRGRSRGGEDGALAVVGDEDRRGGAEVGGEGGDGAAGGGEGGAGEEGFGEGGFGEGAIGRWREMDWETEGLGHCLRDGRTDEI